MTLIERIRQLRSQMLIHSYIYYSLDGSIITDHQFDERASELATLQQQLFMPIDWYDAAFMGWTGATGCHLPVDGWVIEKAQYLMRLVERRNLVSFF